MLASLLAIGALVAIWFLAARYLRAARGADSEAALLKLCHGDREQRDRLIELEMRRVPGLSRHAAAQRAIESRRRDNR